MEVRSLAKVAACAIERAATRDRPKVSGGGARMLIGAAREVNFRK